MSATSTQSAHVCTNKHPFNGLGWMPNFSQSSIWILCAADSHASAEILWARWLKLKSSKVSDAILAGNRALIESATSDEQNAIDRGLLLHIGVEAAVQKARELHDRRRWEVIC